MHGNTYVLYLETPPVMTVAEVASTIGKVTKMLDEKGYALHSLTPHIGIVDGVSCTVGYTIVGLKNKEVVAQNDELPIMLAVG